jgi:hypothetical protein
MKESNRIENKRHPYCLEISQAAYRQWFGPLKRSGVGRRDNEPAKNIDIAYEINVVSD